MGRSRRNVHRRRPAYARQCAAMALAETKTAYGTHAGYCWGPLPAAATAAALALKCAAAVTSLEGPHCDVAACAPPGAAPGGDAFAGDRLCLLHPTLPLKTRP
jgi:hypothetical protein